MSFGGFLPSSQSKQFFFDVDGRVLQSHVSRGDDPALGEANSIYATDAEKFGTIAPFLKVNRTRDAKRRNYVIQPGGACLYFDTQRLPPDPYDHNRVQYTAPSSQSVFGHDSLDATRVR